MRKALVTGGASGIGKACCDLFSAEGYAVTSLDLASGFDVTSEDHWDALDIVPDVLIASAGISDARPLAETSLRDWQRVQSVNVNGVFLAIRYGLRKMERGGSIVVLGSVSGVKVAPGAAAYSTSKAAVRMLVRAAAAEAKAAGIRVNSVAPAGVATPIWESMAFFQQLKAEQGEEAAWNALGGRDQTKPPLERMALPEEIARAVRFLCSADSGGMTGAELVIDAGYSLL